MNNKESLVEIIERGGLYRDITGLNPVNVITNLISALPVFPSVPADSLLSAVLEREALMPTGIGRGIALPHPRNPAMSSEGEQFITLAYLNKAVDWKSLDGEKVDTLILIVSASAKQHLSVLSEINFLCRQDNFLKMLKDRADLDLILKYIREAEKQWR